MGGIADYSGSLVLQLPIADAATATAQWAEDTTVHVRTTRARAGDRADVSIPLDELLQDYGAVRARLASDPASHWAAYVAGTLTVLHCERGVAVSRGVDWVIDSDVPAGKGVSSSA